MPHPKKGRPAEPKKGKSGGRGKRKPEPSWHNKPKSNEKKGESWEKVAGWYDEQVVDPKSHQQQILIPCVLAMLSGLKNGSLLDVGCGQGLFCRELSAKGWQVTGFDIAPAMIEAAKKQPSKDIKYLVDDAVTMKKMPVDHPFDAAISIMQLMNVERADKVLQNVADRLKSGGHLIAVILHPAFRIPRQSHWGWDEANKMQFRRINRYLSPLKIPIVMHPGKKDSPQTHTWHRSLSWYLNAIAQAGLTLEHTEEWCSTRRSNSGPRAKAENLAAEEFPLFLAMRAKKL